ncbi:MAG: DNA translocase FtsK [Duodenibacillus massiliensis]
MKVSPRRLVKVAAKPAAAKAAGGRIAPDTMLLDAPPAERNGVREDTVKMTSRLIESKLKTYKIQAKVVGARVGPVITQYWLDLAEGVKGSTIESIRKDLTRTLRFTPVRRVGFFRNSRYALHGA